MCAARTDAQAHKRAHATEHMHALARTRPAEGQNTTHTSRERSFFCALLCGGPDVPASDSACTSLI
eukprot:6183166-Pleurochrysis_carterae.AAC.7